MRSAVARHLGMLLAVLAMVSSVTLGSVVWPDTAQQDRAAALEALSVVCQGGTPAPVRHRTSHDTEATLCPPAAAFAVPLAVLAGGPSLPPPRSSVALSGDREATAGPRTGGVPEAAFPRGPPVQA